MKEKIKAILIQTRNLNKKHFDTLIGERPFGSQWGKEMSKEDFENMDWEQVPSTGKGMLPFCMYFKASPPSTATQNCEPSTTVAPEDIQRQVGAHGIELVSDKVKARACTEAWLIVGPAEDENGVAVEEQFMVWTAFPGELMPPMPKEWDGKLESLDLAQGYAVKGLSSEEIMSLFGMTKEDLIPSPDGVCCGKDYFGMYCPICGE